MIWIVVTWLYVTAICYPLGVGVHAAIARLTRSALPRVSFPLTCLTGLLAATFYFSLVCLFAPLGAAAQAGLILLAIATKWINRKQVVSAWRGHRKDAGAAGWFLVLVFLFFVAIDAFISGLPSSHYDDGLYYSTCIRWLEDYGTVKGLANINPRIGFNSAWLIAQAGFGFRFLHAGLFNDLNGLVVLYGLMMMFGALGRLRRGDNAPATIVQSLVMLPILAFHEPAFSEWIPFNLNLVSSSSADVPVSVMIWATFLVFLQTPRDPAHRPFYAGLTVFFAGMLVTLKLIAVPLLFLPAFGIWRSLRDGTWRRVLSGLGPLVCLPVPWLIRNVLLSGYLLFPLSKLDLFAVDWKVSLRVVLAQEQAVKYFAIDPARDPKEVLSMSLFRWVPIWFARLARIEQATCLAIGIATILFAGLALRAWRRNTLSFRARMPWFAATGTALAGIFFWFWKGPDFRFGWGFIGIYVAVFIAAGVRRIGKNRLHFLSVALAVFALCAGIFESLSLKESMWNRPFRKPLAYRMPEAIDTAHFVSGTPVYIVPDGGSWNAPLPVANRSEFADIRPEMRGATIREGFRAGSPN